MHSWGAPPRPARDLLMTHRGGAGNWDLSWVESDPRPTARPRGSKGLRKQEGASEGKPPRCGCGTPPWPQDSQEAPPPFP